MSLSSIIAVPKPMRTHDDPRDDVIKHAIVDLVERFDFNASAAQDAHVGILDVLLKAAHTTQRDRQTVAALARGARMCPSCGNFPPDGAA